MSAKLLVIDDSDLLRREVIKILEPAGLFTSFCEAANGIDGFKLLLTAAPDVVLCDLEMPGVDGLRFLDMRNARPELLDVPVIMLTAREEPEQKIRGFERGASDYVTKPFDAGELIARVRVQLKVKRLQDDLKAQNRELEILSNTDPLTQLANRRCLMQTLQNEFQRSQRIGRRMALILADIDHFKLVNDTYGHQQGDAVLKKVAGVLRAQLRDYDLAARFGGEEFALLLPEAGIDQAVKVAERVRATLAGTRFSDALAPLRLTISCGVVNGPSAQVATVDDLIRIADDALYTAKREGRNRVVFAG